MQKMNTTQRISFFIGILLASVMAISLVAPALQNNQTQTTTDDPIEPTNTPAPTLPPPLTDFSGISFDEEYLHSSGLYTVALPTGWDITPEFNNGLQAQTNLNNADLISVISAYIQERPAEITDLEGLSAIFTQSALQSSWARYREWQELARRINVDAGRVDIDFQLVDNRGVTFLARHGAWFDDNYIYVMRVVMPENNIAALDYMFASMIPSLQIEEQFIGTPVAWSGYFDSEDLHFIRFPNTWQVTDSAPGLPASIEGLNVGVRVEAVEGSVSDEDAASAYITGRRPDATILSVQPVSREGADGFAVAYAFANSDGVPQSGYTVLLNGEDKLHVANVIFEADNVDLNNEEARSIYSDYATSMDTFSLMLGLNLRPTPEPEVTATPTTVPEITPEVSTEATAEATESAQSIEATPEAEVTEVEPTEEVTPEVEVTEVEPTEEVTPEVEATEVEPTDEATPEIEATEVEPTDEVTPEVEATEVEPTDEATPEIEATEVEPTDEVTPEVEVTEVEPTEEATPEATEVEPTEEVTPEPEMTEPVPDIEATPEVEITSEPELNIVQLIESDDDFTILFAALEAADLIETLEGEGPFTIFAPTNQAFEEVLETLGMTADELMADTDLLTNILLNHVLDGAILAENVLELDGETMTTLAEQDITVTITDGIVVLNENVNVLLTNIETANGIIHVIDSVLMPQSTPQPEATEEG